MKLGKEKSEKYCRFEAEFTKAEWLALKDYGLQSIQKDDSALVNYAFNKILKEKVESCKK